MRTLKLRFAIPENDDANVVGKLFKEFLDYLQPGDDFIISERKLNLRIRLTESNGSLLTTISEMPFQYVEFLSIEEDKEERQTEEVKGKSDETKATTQKVSEDHPEDSTEATSERELHMTLTEEGKLLVTSKSKEEKDSSDSEEQNSGDLGGEKLSKKEPYSRKKQEVDEVGKKFFEEEAQKSRSYEEFVDNIGRCLGISRKNWDFYFNLVKAVCKLDVVSTNSVAECMDQYQEGSFESKRTVISSKIKKYFTQMGSNVRFLSFLEEIRKYEKYDFNGDNGNESDSKVISFKEAVQDQTFYVLSEDLVAEVKALGEVDFSSKVGFIFDKIKKPQNEDFYRENRGEIIGVVTSTAEDYSSEKYSFPPLSTNATKFFGDNSNVAVAFISQTIKNYCVERGMNELLKDGTTKFFTDLIRLM